MSAALGIVGRLSFDSLGTYRVGWHARPVMEAFIEAEKRAWEAEDNGGGNLYYGEDLAVVMRSNRKAAGFLPACWPGMRKSSTGCCVTRVLPLRWPWVRWF